MGVTVYLDKCITGMVSEISEPFLYIDGCKLIDQDENTVLIYEPSITNKDIINITEFYIQEIANSLWAYYRNKYDLEYWKIVSGWWSFEWIQALIYEYYFLQFIIEFLNNKFEHVKIVLGLSKDIVKTDFPSEFNHYYHKSDLFRICFRSQILEHLNLPTSFTKIDESELLPDREKSFHPPKKNFRRYILEALPPGLGNVYQVSFSDRLKINKGLVKKYLIQLNWSYFKNKPNTQNEFKFVNTGKSNGVSSDFHDMVKFLTCLFFPAFLINYQRPTLIKSNIWIDSHAIRHQSWEVAHYVRNGGIFFGLQHGGTYGINHSNYVYSYFEIQLCKNFVSSGWINENNRVRPLPLPMFSKLKKWKKKDLHHKYLYTATRHFKVLNRATTHVNYLQNQLDFFDFLNEDIRKKFVYRPYFHDPDAMVEKLTGKNLVMEFDTAPNLADRFNDYSLLVVDNLNTVWLQGLVVNIPLVLFWNKNIHSKDDKYNFAFDWLRGVKILHHSSEDAAAHINGLGDDILQWWNSDIVQQNRRIFLNEIAKSSETEWITCWIQFFNMENNN